MGRNFLYPVHPDKVFPVPAMAPVLAPVVVPVLVVAPVLAVAPAAAAVLAVVGVRVAAAGKPVVDLKHHPSLKEPHSRQNAPVCNSFVRNSKASTVGYTNVPALVPVTIHLHHLYPVHPEIYPVA